MPGECQTSAGHDPDRGAALLDLISEACANSQSCSPSAASVVSRLRQLSNRLTEQRLQLAVLGQFKRGKSTLLNALLGVPILPMAVTPLTAIPTFIDSGETFDLQTVGLQGERNASTDLIAGDRKQILAELDSDSEQLRQSTQDRLDADIASALDEDRVETDVVLALETRIPSLFRDQYENYELSVRQRFEKALRVHQERAQQLIARVRQTAAELLEIPYAAPAPEDAFELKKAPYWVTKPRETLHVLPPGAMEYLWPSAVRRRHAKERLSRETGEVIRRNVENLRWSLHRALEDGFRGFQARLDEQLALTLAATREALRRGLQQRYDTIADAGAEVGALRDALERLGAIRESLRTLSFG